MSNYKDRIENLFNYHIDVDKRILFIVGDITDGNVGKVIKGIYFLDAVSDNTITVEIYTGGGDFYGMFAIYDCMRRCRSNIITRGIGCVMSAGILLLAAGEKGKRCAFTNTQFMMHDILDGVDESKGYEVESVSSNIKIVRNRYADLLSQRSKMDVNFIKRTLKGADHYFNAEQALKYGVIDKVIEVYE